MEYPLNIYITAHTLISSLGFGISENKKAIHDYRSGIRMQEAGRISDSPILAGMIDSVELEKRAKKQLEKRAKELDISSYTRLEQLFIFDYSGSDFPIGSESARVGLCFVALYYEGKY